MNKKHLVLRQAVLMLCLLVAALPAISFAQTGTSSVYGDGSGEPGSVRQEWIRGYRQQSSDLQQKIAALPGTPTTAVSIPVLFGVELRNISPNFGDPRSGGRTHEGEDIMAVKGTPIVSPTPAVVLHTGVGATEGNYVYTANPGGETFVYMHLDRIGEGVVSGSVLAQGALIGYVGNTGNASGGAAHLHFEIHTSSGVPINPYPRLTSELSLQEKISDLSAILILTSDSAALSQFLVANFRSTFTAAIGASIALPVPIANALASIPPASAPPTGGGALPAGDLDLGSRGAEVTALQSYLIQSASGPAAARLASAGATGNFGPITKAALVEYQTAVGIFPSNGYYGTTTHSFIAAHPRGIPIPPIATAMPSLTRNLHWNLSGEDVRTLQATLNTKGFMVAVSGPGSPGNETAYFGRATEAAVIRFQIARSIAPAVGFVGPLTRAALASL